MGQLRDLNRRVKSTKKSKEVKNKGNKMQKKLFSLLWGLVRNFIFIQTPAHHDFFDGASLLVDSFTDEWRDWALTA